jgi:hypothetical protein
MVKISANQIAQSRHAYIYCKHPTILKGLVYLPIFSIDSTATENRGQ